jgi:hypothetical protein
MWHHAYDVMRSTPVSTHLAPARLGPAPDFLTRVAVVLAAALTLALLLVATTAPTAERSGTAYVIAPGGTVPRGADEVRVADDPLEAARTAEHLRAQGLHTRILR